FAPGQGPSDSSVIIDGAEGNTFRGSLTLRPLTQTFLGKIYPIPGVHLLLNKQSGPAVMDRLIVENGGTVTLRRTNQLDAVTHVFLEAGSKLLFENHDQTANFLTLTNFHADADSTLVDTGTGTLTLVGGIMSWVDNNQGALPTIKGRLELPSGDHFFHVAGFDYAGLDLQAQIVGDGGFNKTG